MTARFNEIKNREELENLFQKSFDAPVILFKHSITCPISIGVYSEVSRANADINLVIVQKARNLSNAIAEITNVRHESPQAIVVKQGSVVFHASHYDITAEDLEKNINS